MSQELPQRRPPLMGMNLELKRSGVAFHIQTEDMGLPRGELVTQLFAAGVIIETLRLRYFNADGIPPRPPPSELQLRHQMRDQHLSLVRAVQAGRYDPRTSARGATPQHPSVVSPPVVSPPVVSPPVVSPPVVSPSIAPPSLGLEGVDQLTPSAQSGLQSPPNLLTSQAQRARPERASLGRAQLNRELEQIQRGLGSIAPHELIEELLFTAQERHPDFKASQLALRVSAREALSQTSAGPANRGEEERS